MDEIRPEQGNDITEIWQDYMSNSRSTTFYGRVALGNGTAFNIGMMWINDDLDNDAQLFVGVEDHGAYTFNGFVHEMYAQEKLKLLDWDAMNIADFINRQLGLSGKRQGRYINSCVKK